MTSPGAAQAGHGHDSGRTEDDLATEPGHTEPLRGDLLGPERLEEHARRLARAAATAAVVRGKPLLGAFRANQRTLVKAHRTLAETCSRDSTDFCAGSDWILDNFHIITDTLAEIRTDLPRGYYSLLPKLTAGPLAGYPRVYQLAAELIAHTDSAPDEAHLSRFVQAYQEVTPLSIGELWAVPIMLRLVLVDNLRRLADQVVRANTDHLQARAWLQRCAQARADQPDPPPAPNALPSECSDEFLLRALEGLRDGEAALPGGPDWLHAQLAARGLTAADVLRRSQQRQAANQVSIGNCVTSLRLLSALDWSAFFERTSLVEAVLRRDPSGTYPRQDFATRDRYRRTVEKLSRGSGWSEVRIAEQAVALASRPVPPGTPPSLAACLTHVGYYLVDAGASELEAAVGYHPTPRDRVLRLLLGRPAAAYFSSLVLVLLLLLAGVAAYAGSRGAGTVWIVLAVLVAALPASELAVAAVHRLLNWLVPPRILPKLLFKDGVPEDCAACVVIPGLLTGPDSARVLLDRLEVHYLSNPDPRLRFALLTDFADAPEEQRPEDEAHLRAALDGVRALNAQYADGGPDRFFVCHRRRVWDPVQGCWMGWERKRGKLAEFNRLLRGARDTTYQWVSGDVAREPRIRFVITLDADTRMPREAAGRMIATLAHPLNQPRFDPAQGRVVAGYGLLQPRVSFTLTGAGRSLFARIFSGSAGLDPYVTAVSDVYQDLFGEGSFTGKGLYDVDAFEAATGATFPDDHILSHDLIEGNYARCGLASDIELLDDFPALCTAYARREHRWVRGDWQLLPWLGLTVPLPGGRRRPNPLTALGRWKVFDNLRRSLVPPALLLLLLLGWTVLPGSPVAWTALALAVAFWPLLAQLLPLPLRWLKGLRQQPRPPLVPDGLGCTAGQVALSLAFLPEQAARNLDAIGRTLWRLFVTGRNLLEWEASSVMERRLGATPAHFWRALGVAAVFALLAGLVVALVDPSALLVAAPILALWFVSPAIAYRVSQPLRLAEQVLAPADVRYLRRLARKMWSYFEDFVTAQEHWLPPDNYQQDPKGEIAHRTSPTNMGLYLVSCVTAHDLGYLALPDLLDRLRRTLGTFRQMQRSQGHFFNWYETTTLKPLPPLYVSTVDSGNLLGCLVALRQSLDDKEGETYPGRSLGDGLLDTLDLVGSEGIGVTAATGSEAAAEPADLQRPVEELRRRLEAAPEALDAWDEWLQDVEGLTAKVAFSRQPDQGQGPAPWAARLLEQVRCRRAELTALAPWAAVLREAPPEFHSVQPAPPAGDSPWWSRWQSLLTQLARPGSLADLAARAEQAGPVLRSLQASWPTAEGRAWLARLAEAVGHSRAAELLTQARALADEADAFARDMDFAFLYNERRHLFAVGYNLTLERLDSAHYDLLASEAALTSFLAVARGDVPTKHWFQLGRPSIPVHEKVVLLSWGGTMFEYLMPRLFLRPAPGTLLYDTQQGAVQRQIDYARQAGVPWGISESAYSAVDAELNYQYQTFGVPGLGLKRGLSRDLVVAPYATFLALMVAPAAAVRNLRALAAEGAESDWGFCESIDYTASRLPPRARSAVVKCVMAHHQGMALTALANCLLGDPLPRRFHREPIVRATELLLQERVPGGPRAPTPHEEETDGTQAAPAAPTSALPLVSRRVTTPNTSHPRTHLVSNGRTTAMLTNAGGSRLTSRGLDVTRWREDRTADDWGSFLYVRHRQTGDLWSAAFQPVRKWPREYEAVFSVDKAEFRRLDGPIETRLEVTVSPEHDAEVRRLTLTNHDTLEHELELTSYAEIVLAPHGADLAHPAFAKLFVETEYVPREEAILCRRRPRSSQEKEVWGVHVLAAEVVRLGPTQYETDRARFLGRGRSLARPAALDPGATLSGTTGAVLDPIVSLRCRVRLAPETSVRVAFTTALADSRDEALALADSYHGFASVNRAFDLAWAQAQVELRHLHLSAEEAHLYQRLGAHLVYAGSRLRAAPDVLAANRRGQAALWAYGISGDLPIMLVLVRQQEHLYLARQAVAAHAYLRSRGLAFDLVILNEHEVGYFEDLHRQLHALLPGGEGVSGGPNSGAVFLRKAGQVSTEDQVLLQAAARVVLDARHGLLANQLERLERPASRPSPGSGANGLAPRSSRARDGAPADEELAGSGPALFVNGLGGFSEDGREYVLTLGPEGEGAAPPSLVLPPAPWANVAANPMLGCLITESGLGCTWYGNSQTNRLTPWSNDPVTDPPGEVVYLRDDVTGEVWTPTPRPAGSGPYRVRHAPGCTTFEHASHGLAQELTVTVHPRHTVKTVRLRLRNTGRSTRRLSAAYFAEWVLGSQREQAAVHVVTEAVPEAGAILARNAFHLDYSSAVAFAAMAGPPSQFTADRTEFLGRNGTLAAPAGLARATLSGAAGGGLDPCAVLQKALELKAGEEKEVVFLLGAAEDAAAARRLIMQVWQEGGALTTERDNHNGWDRLLATVQVRTPNPALDVLVNRWLPYQVLSARVWGRCGFYQSSGAYGFRDQLQDVMALVWAAPDVARAQVLRAASRQFPEGDVQHWWHPPRGAGVRTRCSDDMLWLPFAVCHYVAVTGDRAVLDESVPFLEAPRLPEGKDEEYRIPEVSSETASVYEHCLRAIEHGCRFGVHGLPLMGSGDWNDGMNRVGREGKGESIWLAWFLIAVLRDFADLAQSRGDTDRAADFRARFERLRATAEEHGWDGQWYLRAYYDDGSPLGSARNDECRIDSIAQTWAVLSGVADPQRVRQAWESLEHHLVRRHDRLLLLFTPPFDRTRQDPGYIKGYVPGIRENGGQYTHAAAWCVLAATRLGLGSRAVALFDLVNPINQALAPEEVSQYRVEPYVLAGDVCSQKPHTGRGGWTWYTGAAGWLYRAALEGILGFRLRGDTLTLDPCIPASWPECSLTYRRGTTTYHVLLKNPAGLERGVKEVLLDGRPVADGVLPLTDDGATHTIEATLG